jgi:hypothetical protein
MVKAILFFLKAPLLLRLYLKNFPYDLLLSPLALLKITPWGKVSEPFSFSWTSSNTDHPTELSYSIIPKENLILLDSHDGIIKYKCKKDSITFIVQLRDLY